MAIYYSDHFIPPSGGESLTNPRPVVTPGIRDVDMKASFATWTPIVQTPTGSTIRMLTMKSSDRLVSLLVFSDLWNATYRADVGVAVTGHNSDGATVDIDVLADNLALYGSGSGLPGTELLGSSNTTGSVGNEYVGLPLWQIASIDSATYTEDPVINLDIILTSVQLPTTWGKVSILAQYMSSN